MLGPRVRLLCALLIGITGTPLAGAPSSKLALVASGVWFRSGFSNTMIVEMKDYLMIIDSGMKDTALATQKEKVLFTGDAVVNGPFNSFMDSDVRNWPKVIRRLEALDVRHVLPGHGKPGSKEILGGQREYLEALVAEVTRAIQHGKKLEDLVEMKNGTPTVSRLALPSSLDHWAKDSLAGPTEEWPLKGPTSGRKVRDVYTQLSR